MHGSKVVLVGKNSLQNIKKVKHHIVHVQMCIKFRRGCAANKKMDQINHYIIIHSANMKSTIKENQC